MTDREALAQVDRLIDECKDHIVRQAEVVANALQKGRDTEAATSMLRALEARLSALEKDRQNILDRLKSEGR
jgi:hypothetical protein